MIRLLSLVVGMMLLCVGSVSGVFAEGEQILDVTVAGNRRIESAAILNVVKTKPGDLLIADKVDADVRAIYRMGHFANVAAETNPVENRGVVVTFRVQEKPLTREIKIEGNKEIAADKIREAMDLKANTVFTQTDLAKSLRKIKKLYADEGYYLADVQAATEKKGDYDVRVTLTVKEGDKVLIRDIKFEGNKVFSARKLRGVMETKEKWFMSWLTGAGTYKEDVLKNDAALIADLYMNNGYIAVKVGEPEVKLLDDKKGLNVTIGITEGDQYRVGALDYKGDLLETKEELAKKVKLRQGEIFNRSILRGDVVTLTDAYADQGYAFANVVPVTRVNADKKTVDITFDFEKGQKVYIDRINIAGNTKTRDKVARRELKLDEGDLYSATGLRKSKQALMNLGYFEEVNIATAPTSDPNKLNLNIDVKEKPTGTFSIGAGYSSIDGLIGQGSVQQANFLGLGLKANAAVSIGGKSSTYNLGLSDPYFLDSKWTIGGDLYRTEREFLNFKRRVTGGDIKAGYPLSDTVSSFVLYKYEAKHFFDIDATAKNDETLRDSTTSSILFSLSRNTTDYRLDPTRGMVNNISLEYAGLGGSNRFARLLTDTTVFYPGPWTTVFSVKGTAGYIQKVGKDVPRDERFLLGGISTLRGYSARTVGPIVETVTYDGNKWNSATKDYIGGTTEAIVNAEYVFPLLKDAGLKGVAFFDAGTSFGGVKRPDPADQFSGNRKDTTDDPGFTGTKRLVEPGILMSYGLGIRWFSPIGPLRLEYGIPVNPRPGIDKPGGKLEFSIGGFF